MKEIDGGQQMMFYCPFFIMKQVDNMNAKAQNILLSNGKVDSIKVDFQATS